MLQNYGRAPPGVHITGVSFNSAYKPENDKKNHLCHHMHAADGLRIRHCFRSGAQKVESQDYTDIKEEVEEDLFIEKEEEIDIVEKEDI